MIKLPAALPLISGALLLTAVALVPSPTSAHSGGLNSSGCHAGSRPYHCHRAPSEMVGNRLRCDLGSRSIECNGRGAARPLPSETVRHYQIQLQRHCSSLPFNFADGLSGPASRAALMRFQRSYGLEADGVYGPRTAAALEGGVTGACR